MIQKTVPGQVSRRGCVVCGGTATDLLFRQEFAALEAGLLRGYDVVACRECGFAYADGIPEQTSFDAYYRDLSKYEKAAAAGRESEHDMTRFRAIADLILPHVPTTQSRIMDVGCSTGGLLAILKERGFTDLIGLDPSPACAEAARRLHGVEVLTNSLADVDVRNGSIDLCILIGVLEHVRELLSVLATIWNMVAASGRIYVEVPDAANFTQARNAPFQEFSVEHINFFGPNALNNVLGRAGFKPQAVTQCIRESHPGTLSPVICGIYEKTDTRLTGWVPDEETPRALTNYIQQSQRIEDGARKKLRELAERGDPILIWGVGTLTLRLLETGALADIPIAAFVDSNPKYQGQKLRETAVIGPDDVRHRSEPILVSSWVWQHEIAHQIRNELRLSNPLIMLYQV
jgi:SAM-dependent methyltransferase